MSITSDESNLSIQEIRRLKKNEYNRQYQKNKYANDKEYRQIKLEKESQYQKENRDKVRMWQANFRNSHREQYNEYKRNYYHTVIKPKREAEKQKLVSAS